MIRQSVTLSGLVTDVAPAQLLLLLLLLRPLLTSPPSLLPIPPIKHALARKCDPPNVSTGTARSQQPPSSQPLTNKLLVVNMRSVYLMAFEHADFIAGNAPMVNC